MAMSSGIVVEIRTTATAQNVNGGGYKTGATGVDYSQQNAAQYALTGCTSAGAGNVVLHASAAADMVGNVGFVVSGTNFTSSWFEITAVSVGVSITFSTNKAGTAISTGVGAVGAINIGGALSLGHTNDATALGEFPAGTTFYIKSGTYTLGQALASLTSGTGALPISYVGYTTTRGDNPPLGANQPLIDATSLGVVLPNCLFVNYISFTGTSASVLSPSAGCVMYACKSVNTSTTADRYAINAGTSASAYIGCEIISYRGRGFGALGDLSTVVNCYIHHCNEGIYSTNGTSIGTTIVGNILEGCLSSAIRYTATNINADLIMGNTIYGSTQDMGNGILVTNNNRAKLIMNNIFYGLTTGINVSGGAILMLKDMNNSFFSCGTNATNYTLAGTVVTSDPTFTDVAELTGSTATISGLVLTQVGADFSTVVNGRDYATLVSATGSTAGSAKITAHTGTTITVDVAWGDSVAGDGVWRVITGHNYAVGSNMQALGSPGNFPATLAALTTNYSDLGAVQRKERTSTDPGATKVVTGTAYTINDAALVGSLPPPQPNVTVKWGMTIG